MFVVFIFRIVRAFWVYDFSKFSIRKYSKYSTTAKKRGHFTVFWTFSGVFVNIITDIWRALFTKKLAFFVPIWELFWIDWYIPPIATKEVQWMCEYLKGFCYTAICKKDFEQMYFYWVCQFGHFLRKACWMCEKLNRFCLLGAFVLYADSVKKNHNNVTFKAEHIPTWAAMISSRGTFFLIKIPSHAVGEMQKAMNFGNTFVLPPRPHLVLIHVRAVVSVFCRESWQICSLSCVMPWSQSIWLPLLSWTGLE